MANVFPPQLPELCVPQPPMQRVHRRETPLSPSEVEEARRQERARMEWDETYITAEQARSIPPEAMTPELLSRIKYSQRDWPENRMSMRQALGPLQPGEGETYFGDRSMDVDEIFWTPSLDR